MPQARETVRSLPYPVLEDGNLSYPEGEYTVAIALQADGKSVTVHHRVKAAPFLDRLLAEDKARYGCLVSIPLTGYRRLHLSRDVNQLVEWGINVVGEPPMLRPIIVSVAEISCKLGPEDGVKEAWQGRQITIPKGARLAVHDYLRATASLSQLLEIVKAPHLRDGSFEVEPCAEEGFYFKVSVASDLFSFLQNAGGREEHQGSIFTHIVSRCFEILKQDYGQGEEDEEGTAWEPFRNLLALSEELKRRNLQVWYQEDFSADKVATELYPHRLPQPELEE